ncbi:glycosyltransferase family 2 protein [Candidatus Pacearchaeota archaeon]|nr:glycosyltransferase family 2 protein [Candidatus Pacearchaeota archaeon]
MNKKKLSVIIPIYNAERFIKNNLEVMKISINKYFKDPEIIAVIDGATDNTEQEARKVKEIKVISYKNNQGKGNAIKEGFKNSTGEIITFIDCDMDLHPKLLKNLLPYLSTADMVVGSKRHPFSKLNYPMKRKIMSSGFSIYSKLILGTSLRDTQSGLKLMKREMLEIILPLVLVKRFAFDLELCFLAQKHNFRTVEAPIHITYNFNNNTNNQSTIKLKHIKGMFLDVLAIRYRYTFLRYYQKQFHKMMGWSNNNH